MLCTANSVQMLCDVMRSRTVKISPLFSPLRSVQTLVLACIDSLGCIRSIKWLYKKFAQDIQSKFVIMSMTKEVRWP